MSRATKRRRTEAGEMASTAFADINSLLGDRLGELSQT
jgi:hypothetical protein